MLLFIIYNSSVSITSCKLTVSFNLLIIKSFNMLFGNIPLIYFNPRFLLERFKDQPVFFLFVLLRLFLENDLSGIISSKMINILCFLFGFYYLVFLYIFINIIHIIQVFNKNFRVIKML